MKPANRATVAGDLGVLRQIRDCPKYDTCSVPICPLDRLWHKRGVEQGESVCPYLREIDKPGTVARFGDRYDLFVIEAATRLRAELARHPHPRYAYILREVEASAGTPSMIDTAAARAERMRALRSPKKGLRDEETTADLLDDLPAGVNGRPA